MSVDYLLGDTVLNQSFRQYDVVKVIALLQAPDGYDGWRLNQRAPAIGDVGTIVEILTHKDLGTRYVVECSGADGITIWLGDCLGGEIALTTE